MARTTGKGTSTRRRGRVRGGLREILIGLLRRTRPSFWIAAALVALLAAGVWAVRSAARSAFAMEVFRVDPGTGIQLALRPSDIPRSWCGDDLRRAQRRLVALGPISIFDELAIERARVALETVPWLHSVERIEREFPRTLIASVRTRVPIARVLIEGRTEWIDREAVLLPLPGPGEEAQLARLRSLPMIDPSGSPQGLRGQRIYGQPLPSAGILAGAATAARLAALDRDLPGWRLAVVDTREFAACLRDPARAPSPYGPAEVELFFVREDEPHPVRLRLVSDLRQVSWGAPQPFAGWHPPAARTRLLDFDTRRRMVESWMQRLGDAGGHQTLNVRYLEEISSAESVSAQ
jgi:hypothetical protein